MNEVPSVPETLREALIAALALVESVAEQQAYPDDSWKPKADRLRVLVAQQRAETPPERRYCNKCGYFGPLSIHFRPNTGAECNYMSTSLPAPPERAETLSDEEIEEIAHDIEATDPSDSFWKVFARRVESSLRVRAETPQERQS